MLLLPGETPEPGGPESDGKIGSPTPQTASLSFDARIRAVDQFWNLVDNSSERVRLATDDDSIRNQYRTKPGYQMETRRLLLRGDADDGRRWEGVVAAEDPAADGDWAMSGVYVVSGVVEHDPDGTPVNIAVPAFATEEPGA